MSVEAGVASGGGGSGHAGKLFVFYRRHDGTRVQGVSTATAYGQKWLPPDDCAEVISVEYRGAGGSAGAAAMPGGGGGGAGGR
jgi:hypothetical protein